MRLMLIGLILSFTGGCATTSPAPDAAQTPSAPETPALICVTVKLEGLPPDNKITCLINGKPFGEFKPKPYIEDGGIPYACVQVPPGRSYVFSIGIAGDKGWEFNHTNLADVQPGSVHRFLIESQKEPAKDTAPTP